MSITTSTHRDVRKDDWLGGRAESYRRTSRRVSRRTVKTEVRPGGAFVIALANHKGGVTKTTSTANLGAMFAEAGRRVLLVDCDPQANLSETFGWGGAAG